MGKVLTLLPSRRRMLDPTGERLMWGGHAENSLCEITLMESCATVTGKNNETRTDIAGLLLLTCRARGLVNDHTENRQFIHDQLQLDRQRFSCPADANFCNSHARWHHRIRLFWTYRLHSSVRPCSRERPVDAAIVCVLLDASG